MMLTLLPFDDSVLTARVLDDHDLEDQIKAAGKWLKMLRTGDFKGWDRHSLGQLWLGNEDALALHTYSLGVEFECRRRRRSKVVLKLRDRYPWLEDQAPEMPSWWGMADLHVSHRAVMVSLRPGSYDEIFPNVIGSLDVAWPC